MFEVKLVQSSVFKKLLDALKEILSEAVFECSDSGIRLQAMDSSHVCLVTLHLKNDAFDNYICKRNLALGININSLSKIMKCSLNDDILTLRSKDNPEKISIIFESKNHDRISDYEMRLMNLDQEHLGIPDVEYSCIIKMTSSEFARICKDLSQFGENVIISCSKVGVKFSVSGDMGAANIKLANAGDDSVNIEMTEPVSLMFTIRYLLQFTKATPLANRVTLMMAADYPLVVEYQIGDIGFIKYYLAPKIDDNEG